MILTLKPIPNTCLFIKFSDFWWCKKKKQNNNKNKHYIYIKNTHTHKQVSDNLLQDQIRLLEFWYFVKAMCFSRTRQNILKYHGIRSLYTLVFQSLLTLYSWYTFFLVSAGCSNQSDCASKAWGDYQSCSSCGSYLTCAASISVVRNCPSNLKFDANSKTCQFRSSTCTGPWKKRNWV